MNGNEENGEFETESMGQSIDNDEVEEVDDDYDDNDGVKYINFIILYRMG